MGLTGLEIYKHLPKTNCKECGSPTCLAFAMALAGGKASWKPALMYRMRRRRP